MRTRNIEKLTIEIPDSLDSFNSKHYLRVTNKDNEDVEIKLELKTSSTENIKAPWYKIEPDFLKVQGGGQMADLLLTITDEPIINNSSIEVIEEVELVMIKNTSQTPSLVFKYSLIIPTKAKLQKPVISLVDVSDRLTQLESISLQKKDVSEIVGESEARLDEKFRTLKSENEALKGQIKALEKQLQPIIEEREEEAKRQHQLAEVEQRDPPQKNI